MRNSNLDHYLKLNLLIFPLRSYSGIVISIVFYAQSIYIYSGFVTNILKECYDDSLSNNSCFTKPVSHINIIHWWYIKGQLIGMMSIDQRNWTWDRTKRASFDDQQRDKKKFWHYCTYYFSQHPCPSEHKSSFWLTGHTPPIHCPIGLYTKRA